MSEQARSPADGPPQGEQFAWYHVTVTTYGAWLPGDLRGFRTRHHREHVEGDYKNPPPPECYAGLRRHSQQTLKNPPVVLEPQWRPIIGWALVERFQMLDGFVLCAAMAAQHGHLLVKIPRGVARAWTGLAKKHAWFEARDAGWVGKLWGVRCRPGQVKTREYQLNVYYYILDHEKEGAWVWKWQPPSKSRESAETPGSPGVAPPGTPSPGVNQDGEREPPK
jgi:hypothetical protein